MIYQLFDGADKVRSEITREQQSLHAAGELSQKPKIESGEW